MPDVRIAYRPFAEQLAWFRRKINVPSSRWDELMHGDHAHGFMVAGVTRTTVLDDLRTAIDAAISDGEGFDDFRRRFDDILQRHGWIGGAGDESASRRAWRMRTIFHTNLRTSYMAGRWETLQRFPYLRYQHNTVTNPREQHLGWDGLVLATTDPWWDTHYPPNGWGCRCSITGVGRGRLAQLGKTGPDPTPGAGTGEPPPEWAYHVGLAARSLPAAAQFGEKVMAMPAAWRRIALEDAQQREVELLSDWRGLVGSVYERALHGVGDQRGRSAPLGFLQAGVAEQLVARDAVDTALLAANERDVMHALRDSKTSGGRFGRAPRDGEAFRALIADLLEDLPRRLAIADTSVFWDDGVVTGSTGLVYAVRLQSGGWMKYVFAVDERRRTQRANVHALWLRTVDTTDAAELRRMAHLQGPQP